MPTVTPQTLLSSSARIALLGAIRTYQYTLSAAFGPCCRFHPSCSHYGYEAVARFGALRGGWLAVRRVARCNPWTVGGDDPVPAQWPGWRGASTASRFSPDVADASGARPITVERIGS